MQGGRMSSQAVGLGSQDLKKEGMDLASVPGARPSCSTPSPSSSPAVAMLRRNSTPDGARRHSGGMQSSSASSDYSSAFSSTTEEGEEEEGEGPLRPLARGIPSSSTPASAAPSSSAFSRPRKADHHQQRQGAEVSHIPSSSSSSASSSSSPFSSSPPSSSPSPPSSNLPRLCSEPQDQQPLFRGVPSSFPLSPPPRAPAHRIGGRLLGCFGPLGSTSPVLDSQSQAGEDLPDSHFRLPGSAPLPQLQETSPLPQGDSGQPPWSSLANKSKLGSETSPHGLHLQLVPYSPQGPYSLLPVAEEYGTSEATATQILASAPASDALGRLYDMDGMGGVPMKKMQATLQSARQAAVAAVRRMSLHDAGLSMYLEEVQRVHGEKMYLQALRRIEREAEDREREEEAKNAFLEAHRRAAAAGLSGAQGPLRMDAGATMGCSAMESERGGATGTGPGAGPGDQGTQMGGGAGAEAGDMAGAVGSGGEVGSRGARMHVARFGEGEGEDSEKEAWREKCSKEWAPTDYLLLHGLPGRVHLLVMADFGPVFIIFGMCLCALGVFVSTMPAWATTNSSIASFIILALIIRAFLLVAHLLTLSLVPTFTLTSSRTGTSIDNGKSKPAATPGDLHSTGTGVPTSRSLEGKANPGSGSGSADKTSVGDAKARGCGDDKAASASTGTGMGSRIGVGAGVGARAIEGVGTGTATGAEAKGRQHNLWDGAGTSPGALRSSGKCGLEGGEGRKRDVGGGKEGGTDSLETLGLEEPDHDIIEIEIASRAAAIAVSMPSVPTIHKGDPKMGDEWVHTLCYAWLDVVVAIFCIYNNIQHALSPAIPIAIWLCARGAWLELMVMFSSTLQGRGRECFPLALTSWPPVVVGTLLAFGIPTPELWYASLQLGLCCIADGLPLWISSINFQLSSGVHTHYRDGNLPIYLRMAADRAQGAGAFWQALCRIGPLVALVVALI